MNQYIQLKIYSNGQIQNGNYGIDYNALYENLCKLLNIIDILKIDAADYCANKERPSSTFNGKVNHKYSNEKIHMEMQLSFLIHCLIHYEV